jgi:1,4-dihydroxy-2-naphthoate octaprenyltransferase
MKNTLTRFLHFVEIQTKIASITPLCTGLCYALYVNKTINIKSTLVFFVAAELFDMATTAINNYIDARVSKTSPHFSTAVSLGIIGIFVAVSAALGLYLTCLHGVIILVCGVGCFSVGILYTFGPAPVSRTPYGEVFSGAVMGFCITFLAFFINMPEGAVLDVQSLYPVISIQADVRSLLKIGFVSFPLVCGIANIMLANNICDVDRDIQVSRFTLPYYLGRDAALRLFACLYYLAYLTIAVLAVLQVVPLPCLAGVLSFIPVKKNLDCFRQRQVKSETFPLSGINLLWIAMPYFLLMLLGYAGNW